MRRVGEQADDLVAVGTQAEDVGEALPRFAEQGEVVLGEKKTAARMRCGRW